MQTHLTRQAKALLNALRRHLGLPPRGMAPAAAHDGHEHRWHAQQQERAGQEHARFQLRALGWPSA